MVRKTPKPNEVFASSTSVVDIPGSAGIVAANEAVADKSDREESVSPRFDIDAKRYYDLLDHSENLLQVGDKFVQQKPVHDPTTGIFVKMTYRLMEVKTIDSRGLVTCVNGFKFPIHVDKTIDHIYRLRPAFREAF